MANHRRYIDVVIPEFGVRLQYALNRKGMSQAELGRRIGRDRRIVNSYCQGERYPSFEAFYMICNVLDVSADWLMELEE